MVKIDNNRVIIIDKLLHYIVLVKHIKINKLKT